MANEKNIKEKVNKNTKAKHAADKNTKNETSNKKVKEKNKNEKTKEENKKDTNVELDVDKIIEEQIAEVKEEMKNVVKKNNSLIEAESKELEIIKNEIQEETSLPKEKREKAYSKIYKNVIFGILALIYFFTFNIGYSSIKPESFIVTIRVLSIIEVIVAIILYEIAYKKDKGNIAIYGIELMLVSIATLLSNYFYKNSNTSYTKIMTFIGIGFSTYFIVKTIVIYIKEKKKIKREKIDDLKEKIDL